MDTLFVSLAYKYVALALMLAEANHAIESIGVSGWKPITAADIVSYHITPPRLRPGGSLNTPKYMFGFGHEGKLQFIHVYQSEHALSIEERHLRWAKMKSLVDTNEAYRLATNWLSKLDVDVVALEKAHSPHVMQMFYYEGGKPIPERRVMLPRFEVRWGSNSPAIWVSVFGPTSEPLQIRQEDISFSRRPRGLVKDAERLLSIPDIAFAKYTDLQRSNLVVQSAITKYQSYSLPEVVRVQSTNEVTKYAPPRSGAAAEPTRLPQPKVKTVPPAGPPKD
jgi:hypothetical protein